MRFPQLAQFPIFLTSYSDLIFTSSHLLGHTSIQSYIYLPVESSLLQPHIKCKLKTKVLMLKQTKLLEQYRMGTCVGIGARVQNVDGSILTSNPDTESQPVDLEKASLPF